eukprot:3877799-Rhodomonas_salina.1
MAIDSDIDSALRVPCFPRRYCSGPIPSPAPPHTSPSSQPLATISSPRQTFQPPFPFKKKKKKRSTDRETHALFPSWTVPALSVGECCACGPQHIAIRFQTQVSDSENVKSEHEHVFPHKQTQIRAGLDSVENCSAVSASVKAAQRRRWRMKACRMLERFAQRGVVSRKASHHMCERQLGGWRMGSRTEPPNLLDVRLVFSGDLQHTRSVGPQAPMERAPQAPDQRQGCAETICTEPNSICTSQKSSATPQKKSRFLVAFPGIEDASFLQCNSV